MKRETILRKQLTGSLLKLMVALALLAVPGALWAQDELGPAENLAPPSPGEFEARPDFAGGPGQRGFRHPGRGMRGMPDIARLREQLGLTDDQVKQLHALRVEGAKNAIRSRADVEVKRLELRELLQADQPDRAAIDRKLRELSDARYTAQKQRIDQRLAMRDILTPEQRSKMKELRGKFRRGGERMRRPGGPGMDGPQGQGFRPRGERGPRFEQ